jgi:EF hand
VATIFQRHGFHQPDDCPVIKPFQLTSLIHDIFFAAEKLGYYSDRSDFSLDHNCALVSTLLWNLFDPKRTTPLSVLEAKLTFLLLCDVSTFEQAVNEHFQLVADHNQCVSRVRFESMLAVLAKICAYLDDSDQFEAKLAHRIAHICFEDIPGLVGLNEYQFGGVWRSGRCPGFMVYANILRLVQRLKQAQSVVHQVQCAGCQVRGRHALRKEPRRDGTSNGRPAGGAFVFC